LLYPIKLTPLVPLSHAFGKNAFVENPRRLWKTSKYCKQAAYRPSELSHCGKRAGQMRPSFVPCPTVPGKKVSPIPAHIPHSASRTQRLSKIAGRLRHDRSTYCIIYWTGREALCLPRNGRDLGLPKRRSGTYLHFCESPPRALTTWDRRSG
jgi:hypothetical protein